MNKRNSASQQRRTVKIGIWGGAQVGKTIYITMLYHEMLSHPDRWSIFADSDNARPFIEGAYARLFEERRFVEKTVRETVYTYHVTDKKHERNFDLIFRDVPGELADDYSDPRLRSEFSQVSQNDVSDRTAPLTPQMLFDYLKECDGVLIFLDPRRFETLHESKYHSYRQTLYQLLVDLRDARHSGDVESPAPYLALCLTKIDGKDDYWNAAHVNCGHNAGKESNGSFPCGSECVIFNLLTPEFMKNRLPGLHPTDRIGCFLLSSIGRDAEGKPIVSEAVVWERQDTPLPAFLGKRAPSSNLRHDFPAEQTMLPQSLRADPTNPKGLLEPIEWLLDHLFTETATVEATTIILESTEDIAQVVETVEVPPTEEEPLDAPDVSQGTDYLQSGLSK